MNTLKLSVTEVVVVVRSISVIRDTPGPKYVSENWNDSPGLSCVYEAPIVGLDGIFMFVPVTVYV